MVKRRSTRKERKKEKEEENTSENKDGQRIVTLHLSDCNRAQYNGPRKRRGKREKRKREKKRKKHRDTK